MELAWSGRRSEPKIGKITCVALFSIQKLGSDSSEGGHPIGPYMAITVAFFLFFLSVSGSPLRQEISKKPTAEKTAAAIFQRLVALNRCSTPDEKERSGDGRGPRIGTEIGVACRVGEVRGTARYNRHKHKPGCVDRHCLEEAAQRLVA